MTVASGTRVAVRQRLLEPHERAPSLPEDTADLPYEALVRGILLEPADAHTFGRPPAALVAVDEAISELLRRCRE